LTSARRRLLSPALILASATSTQLGAALVVRLFALTSPTFAAWVRNTVGAAVLLALIALRRLSLRRLELVPVTALGIVLGTMNASFYEAIARLPLGDAVAIEFLGPVAVAAVASGLSRDLLWVALAAAGVVAISRPGPQHLSYAGIAFVLGAATCWAIYIVVGRRIATTGRRAEGLAASMAVSAAWLLLPALVRSGPSLFDVRVLVFGAAIGILSSAIPYSVELSAMQHTPPRVFGVLLSLQPLLAAVMGLAILGQHLSAIEVTGFLLVITASVGVTVMAPVELPAEALAG